MHGQASKLGFFGDFKIPSLIAGPIKPCEYFPAACIISQIIFIFCFFNMNACANITGFTDRDGHICDLLIRILGLPLICLLHYLEEQSYDL